MCPYIGRPWHLDCTDARFIHCCPEATDATRRWLTLNGTFSESEGRQIHALKIQRLLGVK